MIITGNNHYMVDLETMGSCANTAIVAIGAYRACGMPQPWPFWNNRCFRTVKNIFSQVPAPRHGIAHHALDDAERQARHLIAIHHHATQGENTCSS